MRTFASISYVIGAILLIVSCFTTGIATTWWLGGIAVALLIAGCVFQFNYKKRVADEIIGDKHNLK